jgi:transposase
MEQGPGRLRRRRHSAEFKAEAVAACRKPGISVAATVLARSVNANLLRRWIVEAERAQSGTVVPTLLTATPKEGFVALALPENSSDETPIRVEVRRGAMTVSVHWPRSAMHECGIWLRELLR